MFNETYKSEWHLTFLAFLLLAGTGFGQTHLTNSGSFDPDGTAMSPYATIREAACAARSTGQLIIDPGTYTGSVRFNSPITIKAGAGQGVARIGQAPGAATTLKLITYNTHLFGDAVAILDDPLPALPLNLAWMDAARAMAIGDVLAQEDVDLAALQEVWDPVMFNLIVGHAGFLAAHHGANKDQETWEGVDLPGELNSGLALLTDLPGLPTSQVSYTDEAEFFESLASKGYLQTTLWKDGFSIGVFNTHMQAQYGAEQLIARSGQIDQLTAAIQSYQAANPSHPVVVMGDFNVIGDADGEYVEKMDGVLAAGTGLRDVARNVRCTQPGAEGPTSIGLNDLNLYFSSCAEPQHSICVGACVPVGVTCDALCYAAGTACIIPCHLAYLACDGGCTVTSTICEPLCGAAIETCTVGCAAANCLEECCGGFCPNSSECQTCTNNCRAGCHLDCDACVTGCQHDCEFAYSNCVAPCYFSCDACRDCEESCDDNHCSAPGPDARLDYVLYAPSLDGTVELTPTLVQVIAPEAPEEIGDGDFYTKLLSDHNALRVEFEITRP